MDRADVQADRVGGQLSDLGPILAVEGSHRAHCVRACRLAEQQSAGKPEPKVTWVVGVDVHGQTGDQVVAGRNGDFRGILKLPEAMGLTFVLHGVGVGAEKRQGSGEVVEDAEAEKPGSVR